MKHRILSYLICKEKRQRLLLIVLAVLVICIFPQFLFSKPAEVTGLKAASASYDSITLSWDNAEGAAEYYIYRSEKGGLFKHVGTARETSYLDKGVEPGEKYSYKVVSSNFVKLSGKNAAVSAATVLDTPVITADTSKGSALIHIQNVAGADGYTVFRNDEQYSYLDREKGKETVFEDYEAEGNINYKYSVRADRKRSQSKKSDTVSLKLLTAGPIIATAEEDNLVFKWNGNKKYTSYKLYEGKKLIADTKEPVCKLEAKEGTYDLTLTGYGKDIQSPVTHQVFRVEKDESADKAAEFLGQARSDYDKKPGDGSGREVCKTGFSYSSSGPFNWTYVFRPKDRTKANDAANMCEIALKNNNIGYCKNGSRYGSRAPDKLAKAVDYDLGKITSKTGLSCGDLICLSNHYAGLSDCYDGSGLGLSRKYKANSNFTCYRYQRGMKLMRGDVVITAHESGKGNHVAMCLTDADYCQGIQITEVIIAKSR